MDYKVSVIVPVYNAEKYLHKCINSLLDQTFEALQIILVDDGSTDSSGKIIDTFAEKYDNVLGYHKKNGGSSSARNLGITKAKGEYIAFLDSDDWLENDSIEILYNIAVENNMVDIIQFRAFGEREDSSYFVPRSGYYNLNAIKKELFPRLMPSITEQGKVTYLRWSNCLRFYRLDFIKNNHIYYRKEAITFEDFLFNFESIVAAQSYYYFVEKPLYHVVQNPMSKSRNYQPAMLDSCNYIFNVIKDYLNNNGEYSKLFSCFDSTLYFAELCIANEMSLKSIVSNVIRINKVLKSDMCSFLRTCNNNFITGYCRKTLTLIKKNSAIYMVYRYKIRKHLLNVYSKLINK